MGWFSRGESVEKSVPNVEPTNEQTWRSLTSAPGLTCRANPAQLAIVAPLEDRLFLIASSIGSLNRRLVELIPEAKIAYTVAPLPADDPDVSQAFDVALRVTCISDDVVSVANFMDMGQLVKGIEGALEADDFIYAEMFAAFMMLGTDEVLSSLTAVLWALNEPSRNVWGFYGEVFADQTGNAFNELSDNDEIQPIDRLSMTLSIVETNLMGIMWVTEGIFAQKLRIEHHTHFNS